MTDPLREAEKMKSQTACWHFRGILRLAFTFMIASSIVPAATIGQENRPAAGSQPQTIRSNGSGWAAIFQGVEHQPLHVEQPRRQRGHAMRIDLRAPGVAFLVTPGNGDRPLDVDSVTTSHFLQRHELQVAINAAPFHPVVNQEGIPQDVVGLAVSDGLLISEPNREFGAILIDARNQAQIVQQPPASLEGIQHACGGFQIILQDGKPTTEEQQPEPRSAIGISQDSRYLILLVIDGRQVLHSQGATLRETAEWLLKLGAWSGLNLDGGGSTSLAIQSSDGTAKVLNRPIHLRIPGTERPCPNHLGVRARPLEP